MALRETYEMYKSRQDAIKNGPKAHFWVKQENRYVKPFKIYGNLYYVGDDWVCSHLVDTGDGLLLLDGGNCGASAMLVQAIWEAGFNPADVRWLIAPHGHMDHIGAANFFRRMFGTKLFLGAPDAQMFRERPELSMIQESPNCMDALFAPDVEIQETESQKTVQKRPAGRQNRKMMRRPGRQKCWNCAAGERSAGQHKLYPVI